MAFVLLASPVFPVAALKKLFNDLTRLVVINKQRLSGDIANRRAWSLPFWKNEKRAGSGQPSISAQLPFPHFVQIPTKMMHKSQITYLADLVDFHADRGIRFELFAIRSKGVSNFGIRQGRKRNPTIFLHGGKAQQTCLATQYVACHCFVVSRD